MGEFKEDLFERGHKPEDKIPSPPSARESKQIKLSPSTLNLFLECPRCFWVQLNKEIKRPAIPVATITTGLDRVIKEYLSIYRQRKLLPDFLKNKIPGILMPEFPKKGWLEYTDKGLSAKLGGYLDECIEESGHYYVLDHKTRGAAPDSVHKAYQLQMDVYTFLLEENKFPTRRLAYLVYYIPKKIVSGSDFQFEVVVKAIATDPARAKEVFYKALGVLRGPIPRLGEGCSFCKWTSTSKLK